MKYNMGSLAGKMSCFATIFILLATGIQGTLYVIEAPFLVGLLISLLITLPLVFFSCEYIFQQHKRTIDTLTNGLKSIHDNDFSIRISEHQQSDLSTAVSMYNKLTTHLKKQRQTLNQREILLDSIVQASPMGIVLLDPFKHIVYFNNESTQLLKSSKLDGMTLHQCCENLHPYLQKSIAQAQSGMISFEQDDTKQSYYLSFKTVTFNHQPHQLMILKNVSQELSQEELNMWKNAIRLISHELNNSLAPISSLTSSAKTMLAQNKHLELLPDILQTIDQRTLNLSEFIAQYARFARLPKPNLHYHPLKPLFDQVRTLYSFELLAPLPTEQAYFDMTQIEQVLINILKNAHQSGGDIAQVAVKVVKDYDRLRIAIVDRGTGIVNGNLHQALLPFYSTKQDGSGIGLSLCNDIIHAHQGQIKLKNRAQGGLMVEFDIPLRETS
ncbi:MULTISPECIES: sensor histidine kinase [Pseudoalteromonas]|uniref:histidine kinase n=1 Tax=Pseudoalteromonas luteoviolacea (strain 2ta16) TaxID=1353533 RepID=V4H170_PSEL2|nr:MULTISPECIES: ATP-binding protein [Pseudoalteromonas]ESP91196.1 histidine kinase-, DNA gyrase B-, and HSP90-like ATPase [Pseudoalteromonas luteoviolacea 2ta16]MCG7548648.1 ATP-binding protein [Pseudoalteromonas sp. Of7M-16]